MLAPISILPSVASTIAPTLTPPLLPRPPLPPASGSSLRLAFVIAAALACSAAAQPAENQDPADAVTGPDQVWRLHVQSLRDLRTAAALSDEIWSCMPTLEHGIDIQVAPDRAQAIETWARTRGIARTVLVPDVQQLFETSHRENERARARARLAPVGYSARSDPWYTAYHPIDEIHAKLDQLAAASNGLASTFSIGTTIEGRAIKAIRLSASDKPGNPRSNRPQLMFQGMQHAREWIAPCVNMWIAQRMLQGAASEPRIADAMERFEFIVLPVVNADGYAFTWNPQGNRQWRKNRRDNGGGSFGVDLNRNWAFEWGGVGTSTSTTSDIYRGPVAFSEPETLQLSNFIASLPRLRGHIDFHSFGQLLLSPFGYTSQPCADERLFASLNADVLAAIYPRYQRTYTGGPSYVAIYPASGVSPDWVYGARNVPSWTIELRGGAQSGFVLPPAEIIPTCEENFDGVLKLIDRLSPPLLFTLPTSHQAFPLADAPAQLNISIRTSGTGIPLQSVTALVQLSGQPDSAPASIETLAGSFFRLPIEAQPCGASTVVRLVATDAVGMQTPWPAGDQPLVITPALHTPLFADDAELDRGWSFAAPTDTATGGRWERADPARTGAQPEDDATPMGTRCFVTSAAAGTNDNSNDVDGGTTTLLSPIFNGRASRGINAFEHRLSFARWYYGSTQDTLISQLSNDAGQTWVTIDEVGQEYDRWFTVIIRVEDFITPTSLMQLRFIARDIGSATLVEAAIDDVLYQFIGCALNADVNADGGIDGADVEAFFLSWAAGQALGDFNQDGGTDGADIEEFFFVWQRG